MRYFILFILFFSLNNLLGQGNFNMTLVSKKDWGEGGSGCWGHTDPRGIEYAIIGTTKSIKILSLEDPKNPIERLSVPGLNTVWRETRAYGNFIYIVTESRDSVTIIDLTKGVDSIKWKRWMPKTSDGEGIATTHSINIDELGFLYLNGNNSVRGVAIYDVKKDGNNPEFMSRLASPYTHDCYATSTILYTADLSGGVGVYDIRDKKNPILLNRFTTTRNFTHNMWTSADEKLLYTTDEVSGSTIDVYDVSDPKNIKLLGRYQNQDTRTDKTIPHNIYGVGQNFAVTAWYSDGVLITDMTRPDNIVKVGSYDTYLPEGPENGTWFLGCWGVYPYLKSGHIVASDMSTGFYLLKPEYKRASYLEGKTLAREPNGNLIPIVGAKVTIKAGKKSFGNSNASGIYKTGIAEPGNYTIYFSHPSFKSDSASVTLKSGEVVNYDFIFDVQKANGKITDEKNTAIGKGQIIYSILTSNETFATANFNQIALSSAFTDNEGNYSTLVIINNEYSLMATAWGYEPKEIKFSGSQIPVIKLKEGFNDDFITDLGWKNTIKAGAGNWERGVPMGTLNTGQVSNPNKDADGDIGNTAIVTRLGGGASGDFDVDGGTTVMESPSMNLSGMDSVVFYYQKWFYNGGGSGTPNDKFTIYLDNGSTRIPLETISSNTVTWVPSEISVSKKQIAFTSNMKIILETGDDAIGHIVEAGFDNFKAKLLKINTSANDVNYSSYKIYPNPFQTDLQIEGYDIQKVELFDLLGRKVRETNGNSLNGSGLHQGQYILRITNKNGQVSHINGIFIM